MQNTEEEKLLQQQKNEKKTAAANAAQQSQTAYTQQAAKKPVPYQSAWQPKMQEKMGQILDRKPFQYDVNADALYQQYADQYVNQGKMAMMDTMGQAAALTGGYGNSYSQMAGQQAYQGYLQGLTDKIPDLYQMALNQYMQESSDLYNQYALMGEQEDLDYGRYQDQMADWDSEMDRLYGEYLDNRNYDYQLGRDQVSDEQWQAEFDEGLRRFNFENKLGEFAVAGGSYEEEKKSGGGSPKPAEDPEEEVVLTKAEQAKLIHESVARGEITQNQAQALLKQLT